MTPSSGHDLSVVDVGASPTTIHVQPTSVLDVGRLVRIAAEAPPEILSSARTFRTEGDVEDLELSLPELSSNYDDNEEQKKGDTRI